MRIPGLTMSRLAQVLEFSGYGPAVAESRQGLHVRVRDMDFHLKVLPSGDLEGFMSPWIYQNKLPPLLKAVLTIVSEVFVGFADYEFFEGQIDEDFESERFLARSTYLWMVDWTARERLVLNELYIDHVPVWHQLNTIPYDQPIYAYFFGDIRSMLRAFRRHGQSVPALPANEVEKLIRVCVPR